MHGPDWEQLVWSCEAAPRGMHSPHCHTHLCSDWWILQLMSPRGCSKDLGWLAGQIFPHAAGLRHTLLRGILLAKGPKLCLDEVIPECFPNLRSRGMLWLHPSSRLGMCSNPRASERGNPDGNAGGWQQLPPLQGLGTTTQGLVGIDRAQGPACPCRASALFWLLLQQGSALSLIRALRGLTRNTPPDNISRFPTDSVTGR